MHLHFGLFIFAAAVFTVSFIVCIASALTGPRKSQSPLTALGSVSAVLALIFCALAFYNAGQINKTPKDLSDYECRQVTTLYLGEANTPYGEAAASLEKQHNANHCKGGYLTDAPGQPVVPHKFKK